jgi:hypothetical protein
MVEETRSGPSSCKHEEARLLHFYGRAGVTSIHITSRFSTSLVARLHQDV